jgi:hypothetical protein
MLKVQTRPNVENPFYGQRELLDLYNNGTAGKVTQAAFNTLLSTAWAAVKDSKQMRELFFVEIFAFGDIANRQHDLFRPTGKADQGGNAHRELFQWALQWMRKAVPTQYMRFVESDLIRQYTNLENVIGTRVKTAKGKKTVVSTFNALEGVDVDKVAAYLARIIQKSNPGESALLAKWMTNVRLSKRQKRDRKSGQKVSGGRALQPATVASMKARQALYLRLSQIMGWEVKAHGGGEQAVNYEFVGLRNWKKQYNAGLESVLFSTGQVVNMDRAEFFTFLDTAPGGARYRVRRRLLDGNDKSKGKWTSKFGNADLGQWFLEWEKSKEAAQQVARDLTEKIRQGTATDDEKAALANVKKAAKVTTGGVKLIELVERFLMGASSTREMDLMAQSLLDVVNFEVPALVIADVSTSMRNRVSTTDKKGQIAASDVCQLLTTLLMLKNPSDEVDDVLVTFGQKADFISGGSMGTDQKNRFMRGRMVKVNKLIDRTASFSTNWATIGKFTAPHQGNTDFSTVAKAFDRWVDDAPDAAEKQSRIEMIQRFPVFVVVSDGDMNSQSTAAGSMRQFQSHMRQKFGWEGVVVIMDVCTSNDRSVSKFENLDNVIHYYGWNVGAVNSIFTRLHDLDIIDVYVALKTLYESNRYAPVKDNVL